MSMHPFTRLAAIAVGAAALTGAPAAMAATSGAAAISPKTGGSITVGAPITIKLRATLPDTPSDTTGKARAMAVQVKLPLPLVFNSIPFSQCDTAQFLATKTCPSATRLATAAIVADGGPSVGLINASATMWFGAGFQVLTTITTDKPAILNETSIGTLRSSGTPGFGLELYIPIPAALQEPLQDLYPTVRSIVAKVTPPKKRIRIGDESVMLPLTGLGPCPSSRKLPFQINVLYTDASVSAVTKTDSALAVATCKAKRR
jgi:hypothetical protein